MKKGWYSIVPDHFVQIDKNWQVCDFKSPLRTILLNSFRGRPLKLVENEIYETIEKYEKENNQ